MGEANEEQLEGLYKTLLESLEGERRDQVVKTMEPSETSLRELSAQKESVLEEIEQDLQVAVADFEEAQRMLTELEDPGCADRAALERARLAHNDATKVMEGCMTRRTEKSASFAEAKDAAQQQRWSALRGVIKQFGEANAEPKETVSEDSNTAADSPYEPLQPSHVDLVIRIGRFDKVGIVTTAEGVVVSAPGGLFNSDYRVVGVDGKRFRPALANADGTHTVILRCRSADLLASLNRVPPKLLRSKALKLMQLKLAPGDNGFGIDLSEVNHVAGLVKGGKAEAADLRIGDIIVAADGVGIGGKRLVDVLRKGKPSYVFNVVRPAALSALDRADTLEDDYVVTDTVVPPTPLVKDGKPGPPPELQTIAAATSTNGTAPPPAAATPPPAASTEGAPAEDDLKRSLAESLGRMQQTADSLVGPAVRIIRLTPKDNKAMTVEWMPRPGCPKVSHYHLQWKLVEDTEWADTEASKSVMATVVTKGNLKPEGQYQFRVRACSKQNGEWGTWCPPTTPLSPSADHDANDAALSTIDEEVSEVASVITSSEAPQNSRAPLAAGQQATAEMWSDLPSGAEKQPGSPGHPLHMVVVQGMLKDQRQALEAQSARELAEAEARMNTELRMTKLELEAVQEERDDWKTKFLEAAGSSMQQVVEAKEATRAEVLAELEAETKAVEEMKAEASKAVELIRAAEKTAAEAMAEAAHYKKRFDVAKAEAKAETDREADAKVNVVMRNAALEIRDKVKFVEKQTDGHVQRAVNEAIKVAEAKAELARREENRELEAAHEKQLQVMRDMVGASAKHRIGEVQAAQEERVEVAVKQALAHAQETAAKAEAAAVQVAAAVAAEEAEARMMLRQSVLEQQLVAVKREMHARIEAMYSEEQAHAMIARAKDESRVATEKAVREANERAEEKARVDRQVVLESMSEKLRTTVREREKELLAENGRGLHELAESELKEASKLVLHAGLRASTQWGSGNDDFEEAVLKKTLPATSQPSTLSLDDASTKSSMSNGRKPVKGGSASNLSAADLLAHDDLIQHHASLVKAQVGGAHASGEGDDGAESMVAPPREYLRMKARHKAEEQALVARQSADQYREEESLEASAALDDDDSGTQVSVARQDGRAKRTAEKERLRVRQMDEALAVGASLAYTDRAQKALNDALDPADALAFSRSPGDEDIRARTEQHPQLKQALDKVSVLERRLVAMHEGAAGGGVGGGGNLAMDRGDNLLARENMQNILKAGDKGITPAERESLQEVMLLLQQHIARDKSMREMLHDIEPEVAADAAAHETASSVKQDLTRDEDLMGALAMQLQELVGRENVTAKLSEDEKALLRQLVNELRAQQEQAEMRQAQIGWLQAESKRARLTALLDARAELERLHEESRSADRFALPCAPVAAAEDAFSIAVDWMPPTCGQAEVYHLQWRTDEENAEWQSSAASESITVPCCTKGHLRTQLTYQFRVRAAAKSGPWGPWSEATEPTAPNVLLSNMPSRPQLRALTKGRFEARWSPPEGPAALSYELQWRRCDGQWGSTSSSIECDSYIAKTPSLTPGEYYTFRVRASVERYRGAQWTGWSPPSAPVQPAPSGKTASGKDGYDPKPKAIGSKGAGVPLRALPKRTDDEATETVIEADLRGALSHESGYDPTAQAAVEAKLANVKKQRAEDESNLKTLEERNRAIASKAREDQLNELVRMKREVLSRAVENGSGEAVPAPDEPTAGKVAESWD